MTAASSPALAAALLIGTIAASLAPATSAAATTCPTTEWHRIQGWVHKCGMELVDGAGHLVRPLAASIFTMSHDTGRNPSRCLHYQPPLAGAAANYQNWGLSAVLLYISWANVEPTPPTTVNGTLVHHYNATYLKAVDAVVQSFASHGVKVILDMANDRWSSAFTNLTLPSGINVSCGSGMPDCVHQYVSSKG